MKKTGSAILLVLSILFLSTTAGAASNFRKQFEESYRANRFDALGFLVRTNKAIMPDEIKGIMKEALSPEKGYAERMELLDLASAMASMYKHWHNIDALANEVESIIRAEIKKEEARVAELTKWDRFEKTLGNFVMREKTMEMEAKGLAPVVYPHWYHRLFYECKACHQDIVQMRRGTNSITHARIDEGKVCGACHNGKTAFSSKENCKRCHSAGLPEAEKLVDIKKVDIKAVKEAADRLGSVFNPEALPNKTIPLDRFGNIDWTLMREKKAFSPLKSAVKAAQKDEIRYNTILFEPPMVYIKKVVFDHKTHSSQIKCAVCHPSIFKEALGANPVSMTEMSNGNFCGYCHGKVSFKFADCNRCHTKAMNEGAGGAIIRKQQ